MSAVAMVSPVGGDALESFCSVRANITRKAEHPEVYHCVPETVGLGEAQPVVASAISHLDTTLRERGAFPEWLAFMAGGALAGLRDEARLTRDELDRCGLFVALPEASEGWRPDVPAALRIGLYNWAALDPLPLERWGLVGAAGGLAMCDDAARAIAEGTIDRAVVGGVDSFLIHDRLAALDRAYRVASERNVDGFCPGEGAAFVLLEPEAAARARGVVPWAVLRGVSAATAPASGDRLPGATLARVLGDLLGRGVSPLIVCDLNGERRRMKEWGFALSRLGPKLGGTMALEHPAVCVGDLGAASGAALVTLAVRYLNTSHRDRSSALVWATSEHGGRAAVLIERAGEPSGSAQREQRAAV